VNLWDRFVRSVVDPGPDLAWHGPTLPDNVPPPPPYEPDLALITDLERGLPSEVSFVDCERVA